MTARTHRKGCAGVFGNGENPEDNENAAGVENFDREKRRKRTKKSGVKTLVVLDVRFVFIFSSLQFLFHRTGQRFCGWVAFVLIVGSVSNSGGTAQTAAADSLFRSIFFLLCVLFMNDAS